MNTRRLLWIDGLAGLFVGVAVLILSNWLSRLYGLPQGLLLFTAAANLIYGIYSTTLANRRTRPLVLIKLLVIANLAWSVVCLILASTHYDSATFLGLAHLLLEGAFVAFLASVEWRLRKQLQVA
jgi:hypothetical protein